jgi:hypothetical protein
MAPAAAQTEQLTDLVEWLTNIGAKDRYGWDHTMAVGDAGTERSSQYASLKGKDWLRKQ